MNQSSALCRISVGVVAVGIAILGALYLSHIFDVLRSAHWSHFNHVPAVLQAKVIVLLLLLGLFGLGIIVWAIRLLRIGWSCLARPTKVEQETSRPFMGLDITRI